MIDDSDAEVRATLIPMWEWALWEQGLPAMKTPRSLEGRSAWIASKLCSHKARSHRDFLPQGFPPTGISYYQAPIAGAWFTAV